jgi:hypothetical protein
MKTFKHYGLQQPAFINKLIDVPRNISRIQKANKKLLKLALIWLGLVAMNQSAHADTFIRSCKDPDWGPCLHLSVRGASMMPGTDLIGWSKNSGEFSSVGGPGQNWSKFLFFTDTITWDDWNGTRQWNIARLRNQTSGLCMTTDGVPGHSLTQEICDPKNDKQLWTWSWTDTHDGKGFKNPATNLWIDLEGGSYNKGTRVIAWYDSNASNNQYWGASTGLIGQEGVSNSQFFINDTDPYIHYTTLDVLNMLWSNDKNTRNLGFTALGWASDWGYSSGRPAGFYDKNNDVHYASTFRDSVYYSFNGSGVSYISELSDGYGFVDIRIDGVYVKTVNANAPGVHNQGSVPLFTVTGLPRGAHTIELVKTTGAYMLLDGFEVYP